MEWRGAFDKRGVAGPSDIPSRPPLLGEHTDAVLTELGYDAAAIKSLRVRSII